MIRPDPARKELAARLLLQEGGSAEDAERCAAAAERVYDRLHAELAGLLGAAGVQALFARSVRLARRSLKDLPEVASLDGSRRLREHLQTLDAPRSHETATVLFATFLDLIATFIGERLTTEVLRRTWPEIGSSPEDSS